MVFFGKDKKDKPQDKKALAEKTLKDMAKTTASQVITSQSVSESDALKHAALQPKRSILIVWYNQNRAIEDKGFDDYAAALAFFESNRKYRAILRYDESKNRYVITDEYQLKRGLRPKEGSGIEQQLKAPQPSESTAPTIDSVFDSDKEAEIMVKSAKTANLADDDFPNLHATLEECSCYWIGIMFTNKASKNCMDFESNFSYLGRSIHEWRFYKDPATARAFYEKVTDATSEKGGLLFEVKASVLYKKDGTDAQLKILPVLNFINRIKKAPQTGKAASIL